MKNFRFFTAHRSSLTALLIFCNLLLMLNLIVSCQQDVADKALDKPMPNDLATERGPCPGGSMCEFYFTPDQNTTLEICGEIVPTNGSCSYGCPNQNNVSYSLQVTANQQYKVCLTTGTSVCIKNTGLISVDVIVAYEFSGTLTRTIAASGVACFKTNSGCSAIGDGC